LANLEDLKSTKALNILKDYEGKNPYIKKFKRELINNGDISLTTNQCDYIINNYKFEPKVINKVVGISEYLGTELKNQYNLSFTPERILIEYLLADNDKTFHIYGKLKRNQEKSQMYFIPKSQLLDDFLFEEKDIEVDFEKYESIDKFVLSNGTIGRKLYEQQKDGVKFLLSRKGAILADSMGVGKSVQATVAALESGCKRILIVCPSAVKINWQREIGYYDCHDSVIIDGKKWEQAKFTIINFDILKNFHVVPGEGMKEEDICWDNQELVKANFDLIIIDEAHKLKNHKSNRGAIMKDLCTNYGEKRVWLLSGTPVANRPMDYYNLLALINSPIVANWKHYVIRYCEGKQITTTLKNGRQKKVWLTNGASNLEELALKTKNTYLRRLKSDLGDMPEKTIIPIYHKLTDEQWVKHNELWEEYLIERQQKKKRGEPERDLVELGLLRKYIAMQSISKTIELVEDILESGEKVIIFCNFTEELTELKNHFGKRAVTHYGQMSDKDKQKSIDDFQLHDKAEVFIGNIISAGVGITLTKATYVVFNSFDWVSGNNEQGEDRSYRIGQKNNVTIYYQLFENTISVRMWETLKRKKEIIDTIMNEAGLDEDEIIGNIMNKILDEDE
jgi:SWI/SNF-related matrix-associated actin-dependent regulator 1 of chromatin subfamily A